MQGQWLALAEWLRSRDADWFVDSAVLGSLPAYEAGELLEDFGIADSVLSRRTLGRLVDEALREGV